MRRFLLTYMIGMLAFSFVSCERESSLRPDGKVKVNCNVNLATKAVSDISDEIEVLDVLVFMAETGELLSYDRVKEGSISLYFQRGILHHCCFFVNAPEGEFSDISRYDELLQKVSQLSDNAEHFVMQSMMSRMFVTDGNLDVTVSRLCSKITVDNIEPKFMDTGISQSEVVFKRMFLMNVPASISYEGKPDASAVILNKTGYDQSLSKDVLGLISKEFNHNIESSEIIDVDSSLYCYSADMDEEAVSSTKLVLELEISGSPNYYTVLFPKLKPNYEYHIETVSLLGFGSGTPGEVFDRTEVSMTVSVNPWGATDKDAVMN